MGLGSAIPGVDISALLICHLFIRSGIKGAFLFAIGMGLLADIYSGGGHGIFLLAYAVSFGGIHASALFMDLEHPRGQIIIVTLCAFLRRIGLVPGFIAFSFGQHLPGGFFWGGMVTAALTGLLAPFVFYLLDKLILRIEGEEESLVRHDA